MADTHLARRLTWQGAFEARTSGSSIGFVRWTAAPVGRRGAEVHAELGAHGVRRGAQPRRRPLQQHRALHG